MQTPFITVQIRSVYGNELIYPASVQAFTFARLCGTKTLSLVNIGEIKSLGYEIRVDGGSELAKRIAAM